MRQACAPHTPRWAAPSVRKVSAAKCAKIIVFAAALTIPGGYAKTMKFILLLYSAHAGPGYDHYRWGPTGQGGWQGNGQRALPAYGGQNEGAIFRCPGTRIL